MSAGSFTLGTLCGVDAQIYFQKEINYGQDWLNTWE